MTDVSAAVNEAVRQVIEEYDEIERPRDVNNGRCTTVANYVCDEIPAAERHVARTVFRGGTYREYPAHTWVEVDELHYDAERPQGTAHWQNLPIFMRGRPIDPDDVKDKYLNDGFSLFD